MHSGGRYSTLRHASQGTFAPACERCCGKTVPVVNKQRRAIRSALVSGDGSKVVAVVADADIDRCPQMVGDGLALAVAQQSDGSGLLAQRCVARLRERGWEGDDELATQLEVALDVRTDPSTLLPLQVDLEDVADLLESGEGEGGWINLATGHTWQAGFLDGNEGLDDEGPDFDDTGLWLSVPCFGSRSAFRDMEQFIAGLVDSEMAGRLSIAIEGKGAFRRFKEVVRRSPAIEDDWYEFSTERRLGRARAWLARSGYRSQQRVYRVDRS